MPTPPLQYTQNKIARIGIEAFRKLSWEEAMPSN